MCRPFLLHSNLLLHIRTRNRNSRVHAIVTPPRLQTRQPSRRKAYIRRISALLGISSDGYQYASDPDKAWEMVSKGKLES